jgi:hypothetical protein
MTIDVVWIGNWICWTLKQLVITLYTLLAHKTSVLGHVDW